MKFYTGIIVLFAAVAALAQEPSDGSEAGVQDSAKTAGIVFNGIVQDSSFAAGEKLNVEILESGEALQTTVGTPFSVVLPEDTLWNICVTNSDTAGAEKEKCYELVYTGNEGSFSQALGEAFVDESAETKDESVAQGPDSAKVGEPAEPTTAKTEGSGPEARGANDSAAAPAEAKKPNEDVDVDALLAGGDNAKVTELKKVVVQLRRRPKRKPGESVVTAKSIKRMPGLAEADVIKSVQALPGVVASSDFSSKIYVRGGAADQNLFLFDNAVVYSPVHFFGLFSTELYGWQEFRKRIDALHADVKIAVIDACGSGAITRLKGGVAVPAFMVDQSSDMKGYAFITSSTQDESSQESDKLKGSFFTHSLVSGMRGAGDLSGDGKP